VLLSTAASAQPSEPIGAFVVDARGVWARFKQDVAVAEAIDVTRVNLPTQGLGVGLGAHLYPLRGRKIALGIGGEFITARDSKTLPATTEDGEDGPTVNARMSAIAPQVSLNFGHRNGWSYVSGGLAWTSYTAERADAPVADAEGRGRSIHYGGGARWFTSKHLAVSVDLRFYQLAAQAAAAGRPPYPKMRLMVISAGVGLR
jgi:hypothetical protein